MEYVLIWVIFTYGNSPGVGTSSQEFDSLAACERGKTVIEKGFNSARWSGKIKAVCIPKR